jgi:hypothetical protein
LRIGSRSVAPAVAQDAPEPTFPPDKTYRVGQCASGWIPFRLDGRPDQVVYANGVGDRAVWNANQMERGPTTSHSDKNTAAPDEHTIGEGTFVVGEDIRPGRYKARAEENGDCYWARLKDDSGDPDSIIANNNSAGSSSVTIKPSDGAFETSGCTPWVRRR